MKDDNKDNILLIASGNPDTEKILHRLTDVYNVEIAPIGLKMFDIVKKGFIPKIVMAYFDENFFSYAGAFEDFCKLDQIQDSKLIAIATKDEWEDFSEGHSSYDIDVYFKPVETEMVINIIANCLRKRTVLVVDDDPNTLTTIKLYLEGLYKVYSVNSGRKALEFLDEKLPDVMIMDLMMPGLTGTDVIGEIHRFERYRNLPFFFLTGKADKHTVLKCIKYKPNGYFVKPVTKSILQEEIKKLFEATPDISIKKA